MLPTLLLQITQREFTLKGGEEIVGVVGIDNSLSAHITFMFYFQRDIPFIDLVSPSGVLFDSESMFAHLDTKLDVIKFHFDFLEVKVSFVIDVIML